MTRARFLHRLFCLLVLSLLTQLALSPPVSAQTEGDGWPDDGRPPYEPPWPHMTFQPPDDADELGDFVPPDLILTPVATLPEQLVTLPLLPSGAAFSFDEGRVTTIIESQSLTMPLELQFTELPVPPFPITPTAPISQTGILTETIPLTATNTISSPLQARDLFRFKLDLVEPISGDPIGSFDHPVRIVADVRSGHEWRRL